MSSASQTLEEVKLACRQLGDDRVNTRIKAQQTLRELINSMSVCRSLDNASAHGKVQIWTWQDVYRTSLGYIYKEIDTISGNAEKTSDVYRDRKKRTAIGLFKLIISKSKQYLSWSSVINDLLQCLDHPYMIEYFSGDILRIISDAVTFPYSRSMFTVGRDNQWIRTLVKLMEIYENPPSSLDPLSPAQLLHNLILYGTQMTNMLEMFKKERLWNILKSLIETDKFARSDSDAKLYVILAANCLMRHAGLDCRQLCVR